MSGYDDKLIKVTHDLMQIKLKESPSLGWYNFLDLIDEVGLELYDSSFDLIYQIVETVAKLLEEN